MASTSPTHSDSSGSSKHDGDRLRAQDSWEIVEGLRGGPATMQEPPCQEGYLLKRRKWPMKGWHKRYFVLDKGILKYSKREADLRKGKLHGCIDAGLSVMTIKKKAMCIDLDTEDNIYHLKVKSPELFEEWVTKLRNHRVFRQNEIAMYPHERHLFLPHSTPSPSLTDSIRKRATLTKQVSIQQAKLSAWLHSSGDMEKCCRDLEECESYLLDLNLLLKSMEVLHRTYSAPAISALQASTYDIPKKEKRPRRWRSKNTSKDAKASLQVPSCISSKSPRLHASNPNLSTAEPSSVQDPCPESPDSPTDANRLQEDFCRLAHNIHTTLKSAYSSLSAERERMRHTVDLIAPPSQQLAGLKTAYSMDCPDTSRPLVHQMSNDSKTSITESMSEFFDAHEYFLSSSSSENEVSDDDSYISDVSDSVSMVTYTHEGANERQTLAKPPPLDLGVIGSYGEEGDEDPSSTSVPRHII